MFNKWNLDYFKKAGSLEDWLQLSDPVAFPRSWLGVETTCIAPVGNSGLMTPGSLMTWGALLCQPCPLASPFSLGSDNAGGIRRPDLGAGGWADSLEWGLRLPGPNAACDMWTACLCSGSKPLEGKAAAAVLFTVTPGPGLPKRVPECVHTQEREV